MKWGLSDQLGTWLSRARFGITGKPAGRATRPNRAHQLGKAGERLALRHLRTRKKLRLLARNLRLRGGEIDLVMRDNQGTIIFVEVKTRTDRTWPGEQAVGMAKQRRLRRLAIRVAQMRGWSDRRLRIDVIAITWPPGRKPDLRHYPSAVTL